MCSKLVEVGWRLDAAKRPRAPLAHLIVKAATQLQPGPLLSRRWQLLRQFAAEARGGPSPRKRLTVGIKAHPALAGAEKGPDSATVALVFQGWPKVESNRPAMPPAAHCRRPRAVRPCCVAPLQDISR